MEMGQENAHSSSNFLLKQGKAIFYPFALTCCIFLPKNLPLVPDTACSIHLFLQVFSFPEINLPASVRLLPLLQL